MIHLYARFEPYDPLVRWGKAFVDMAKALDRAAHLPAVEVEVRDHSKPRASSLMAVFSKGQRVGA